MLNSSLIADNVIFNIFFKNNLCYLTYHSSMIPLHMVQCIDMYMWPHPAHPSYGIILDHSLKKLIAKNTFEAKNLHVIISDMMMIDLLHRPPTQLSGQDLHFTPFANGFTKKAL